MNILRKAQNLGGAIPVCLMFLSIGCNSSEKGTPIALLPRGPSSKISADAQAKSVDSISPVHEYDSFSYEPKGKGRLTFHVKEYENGSLLVEKISVALPSSSSALPVNIAPKAMCDIAFMGVDSRWILSVKNENSPLDTGRSGVAILGDHDARWEYKTLTESTKEISCIRTDVVQWAPTEQPVVLDELMYPISIAQLGVRAGPYVAPITFFLPKKSSSQDEVVFSLPRDLKDQLSLAQFEWFDSVCSSIMGHDSQFWKLKLTATHVGQTNGIELLDKGNVANKGDYRFGTLESRLPEDFGLALDPATDGGRPYFAAIQCVSKQDFSQSALERSGQEILPLPKEDNVNPAAQKLGRFFFIGSLFSTVDKRIRVNGGGNIPAWPLPAKHYPEMCPSGSRPLSVRISRDQMANGPWPESLGGLFYEYQATSVGYNFIESILCFSPVDGVKVDFPVIEETPDWVKIAPMIIDTRFNSKIAFALGMEGLIGTSGPRGSYGNFCRAAGYEPIPENNLGPPGATAFSDAEIGSINTLFAGNIGNRGFGWEFQLHAEVVNFKKDRPQFEPWWWSDFRPIKEIWCKK